ncbi:hypothetical protein [Kitasatospora sp. NPDC008115]|uniref:hypothetical protein n=1 Tax=Kitasatospora sp. NPDC008115 TaxID=3364022 RepID=UPI0036EB55AB
MTGIAEAAPGVPRAQAWDRVGKMTAGADRATTAAIDHSTRLTVCHSVIVTVARDTFDRSAYVLHEV